MPRGTPKHSQELTLVPSFWLISIPRRDTSFQLQQRIEGAKETCLHFLKELLKQVDQRMPPTKDLFQGLSS